MKRQSITKVIIKDRQGDPTGVRWRARFWSPDGRELHRRFRTRREAQAWIDEMSAAKVTGRFIDPRDGKVTVAGYASAWRARQVHRPSTAEKIESLFRRWVNPHLGDVPLAELRPSMVQSWVAHMSTSLAPATVRVHHGILAGMLNDAVRDRAIASNPCTGTKLPEIPQRQLVIPSVDAVVQIHAAIERRYAAMVHLAAASGMRQGELMGLTQDRVDFLRREVRVDRQLLKVAGGSAFGPPKSKRSVRTIPVPQDVIDSIAAHIAEFGTGPEGAVFTSRYAGWVAKSTVNGRLATAVAAAPDAPAGMTWHGFRHFYASRLIRFGESVKTVQARLGHATAAETLDTYGHLWHDSDDRTRSAASGILSGGHTVDTRAAGGPNLR